MQSTFLSYPICTRQVPSHGAASLLFWPTHYVPLHMVNFASKVEARGPSGGEKGSKLRLFSGRRQHTREERDGFVKEDVVK